MDFVDYIFEPVDCKTKRTSFYDPLMINNYADFVRNFEKEIENVKDEKVVFLLSAAKTEKEKQAVNSIRTSLYSLSKTTKRINFFDLGNVQSSLLTTDKLVSALKYLFEELYNVLKKENIRFLILLPDRKLVSDFLTSIPEKIFNISDINPQFDLSKEVRMLTSQSKVLIYNLVGAMQFYYNYELQDSQSNEFFIRFGEVKDDVFSYFEPLARESLVTINSLDSVSTAFVQGSCLNSANGFDAYLFSAFSHIEALSPMVRFNFYTSFCNFDKDVTGASSSLLSQAIWLYLNSFHKAVQENPLAVPTPDNIEIIRQFNTDINFELTFYHSTFTGRWWMQMPGLSYVFAVSELEYNNLKKGILTDRIQKLVKNFS
jgi:hypothetical protein